MLKLIKNAILLIPPSNQRRGLLLLCLMMIRGGMEVVGVASVVPFLAILGNPGLIETNYYLSILYKMMGFEQYRSFLIAIGLASILIIVVSASFRALTDFFIYRFSNFNHHSLSLRLLKKYLSQPYPFFLQRNNSSLSMTLLALVGKANMFFLQGLQLVSATFVSISIALMLVAAAPLLAFILLAFFCGLYALIFRITRGFLTRISRSSTKANALRYKVSSDTFGGIKELKVLGRENAYLTAFSRPSIIYAEYESYNQILASTPRYVIEAAGFSSILLIAIYSICSGSENLGQSLPILGLYAFGAQRLLPSLQTVYLSLSSMRFGLSSVETLLEDLNRPESKEDILEDTITPLRMTDSLQFRNLCFTYQNANFPALDNINFTISAGSSLGIIGSTGAGKTTLVDVLLGLLEASSGEIVVDNVPLNHERIRAWQKCIGYVPQNIFLADDSIINNIAFGIPEEEIDRTMVEKAASLANIHDFIMTLPEGYQTHVGERGVRLSGGQRQRIGIARALYHNPDVLVFDEATSALDNATEAEVMRAIDGLAGTKTIIMIAHRLSTVKNCNTVLELNAGKIVYLGSSERIYIYETCIFQKALQFRIIPQRSVKIILRNASDSRTAG